MTLYAILETNAYNSPFQTTSTYTSLYLFPSLSVSYLSLTLSLFIYLFALFPLTDSLYILRLTMAIFHLTSCPVSGSFLTGRKIEIIPTTASIQRAHTEPQHLYRELTITTALIQSAQSAHTAPQHLYRCLTSPPASIQRAHTKPQHLNRGLTSPQH
jgi:hypothetical protein